MIFAKEKTLTNYTSDLLRVAVAGGVARVNIDHPPINLLDPRLMGRMDSQQPVMYHYATETGVGDEPDETLWLTSIYFRDPDGIQLEFGAWSRQLTDQDVGHTPATSSTQWVAMMENRKVARAV